ncbi:MAG TPA: SRPBCC family protein [Methylophilaceae bacterium]|jgi:hypothetical protein|nr:SRPBCC family protein [Methylophilaceae bacterium]
MRKYHFLTTWKLDAPRAAVCQAIEDSLAWPEWWPGVERVEELASGDANGIGSIRRYTWKGRLPYRLTFDVQVTHMELQTMVEGVASGDVEGRGRWTFSTEGEFTVARYEWDVRPTLLWMRLLNPLASPLFRWNHDILMQQGGEGLARRLNTRLIDILQQTSTEELQPAP